MKIQIETKEYNARRYSKPWIAKIDFSSSNNGEFQFGDWIGSQGEEGMLNLININVGDIIATGQKDTYKPKNSAPDYFIVLENAELKKVTKIEAYKHFTENK